MYKRFPLKKITKSKQFYLQYIREENNLLKSIDFNELDKIIKTIKKCIKNNNIIYSCGNGGSSSLADHFTCDFIKKSVKTISFTGFNGGKLSKITDFNINFPMANYGIVEDCHISMMHYLSQFLRNTKIKSKNYKKINF